MTSIQPELWVDSPSTAVGFYEAAFGAKVLHRVGEGDDIVAQLAVGEAAFWVAGTSATLKRLSPRAIDGATSRTLLVIMVAVEDATRAADWSKRALGARQLWSLGGVVGLEIEGAPFFLHEPTGGFASPAGNGNTTVRVEVFADDPDNFVRRAVEAGSDGSADNVRDHQAPWGLHRHGGLRDPFGHTWLVQRQARQGRTAMSAINRFMSRGSECLRAGQAADPGCR